MQYIVPIVALFHGRVINKPEERMVETKYSTGGEVEHEVSHGTWFECANCVTDILVDLHDRWNSLSCHRV